MSDAELEQVERRYDSSISMLETLEQALEPLAERSVVLSDLDLSNRFASHVRRLARALAGEEASDLQAEAFETLFDEEISETPGPAFASRPDPQSAVENLVDYLEWMADLEERLGGALEGPAAISGLTAGLADTATAVGRSVAARDDDPEPRRTLEEFRESIDELLTRPELQSDPPGDLP